MTYAAVSSFAGASASGALASFSLTTNGSGNFVLISVGSLGNTRTATGLSSTNATWVALGTAGHPTAMASSFQLFLGTVTSAATATVTITWGAGSAGTFEAAAGQEFSTTTGIPVLDKQATLDGASANWPSLTPVAAGELYFGFAFNGGSAVQGSTSGYVYNANGGGGADGNGMAYNVSCPGSATNPVWGDSTETAGVMVLVMPPTATAGAGRPAAALPGRTWLRRFQHRQILAPPTPPPAAPPPPPAPPPAAMPGATWRRRFQHRQILATPPAPPAPPYITSSALAAGGTKAWFTDQHGSPRLYVGENNWDILVNGGRWNGGNFNSDVDAYLASRAAQGYTGVEVTLFSSNNPNSSYVFTDGRDWDGTYPFTGSTTDPTNAPNSAFWSKRDHFITQAASLGMTVVVNASTNALGIPDWIASWTSGQWTSFGTMLGGRYASQPNILWIVGDDYFGTVDTGLNAWLTALRAAGDTHLGSIQNYQEATSRLDIFSGTKDPVGYDVHAQFEWGYSYIQSYVVVEDAQTYVPTVSDDVQSLVPPLWGDGFFLNSSVGSGQTPERLERQMIWWALSSGAAGFSTGDNSIFPWASGSAAVVTGTFYANVIPAIASAFSSLPGWHKLVADTSSVLVTAGRGTHATPVTSGGSGTPYTANTDAYVTASRVPDGSLAVIYCAQAFSITIDQTKINSGGAYTATWVDPLTGATTAGTAAATYNSATAVGNNSAGDPDWVLVLQASPGAAGSASLSGTGSLTASPVLVGTAPMSGTGSLTASPQLAGTATLSGLGTLSVSGVTLGTSASLSGVGALTASPQLAGTATLSGLGTLSASPALTGSATLSGLGTLSASPQLQGTVSLSGLGTLSAAPALAGTVSLSGSGTLSAFWTLSEVVTLSGSGTLSFSQGQGSATLTGAGTLTASPVLAGTASLAGAGTLTAASTQTLAAAAALSGTGTLAAAARLTGTAALSGTGTLSVATPAAGHGAAFLAFFP